MPLTSPRVSTRPFQAGVAGSRYLSGRNVGATLPDQVGSFASLMWWRRSSHGSSVVAMNSMSKRVVQRPRTEVRGLQRGVDRVVDLVGGLLGGDQVDAEDVGELGLEPELDRGAAVGLPVRAQDAEGVAGLLGGELRLADAEVGQRHAVGVHHPVDVVVRGDQQRRGVVERGVVGQPLRRDVPVRGDDRQVADSVVELSGDVAGGGVGGEQAVWVQCEGGHVRHGGRPRRIPGNRLPPVAVRPCVASRAAGAG